jgi:hypothetical protein
MWAVKKVILERLAHKKKIESCSQITALRNYLGFTQCEKTKGSWEEERKRQSLQVHIQKQSNSQHYLVGSYLMGVSM